MVCGFPALRAQSQIHLSKNLYSINSGLSRINGAREWLHNHMPKQEGTEVLSDIKGENKTASFLSYKGERGPRLWASQNWNLGFIPTRSAGHIRIQALFVE